LYASHWYICIIYKVKKNGLVTHLAICKLFRISFEMRDRCGRDRMVLGFITKSNFIIDVHFKISDVRFE
jgi:hypothetical protein